VKAIEQEKDFQRNDGRCSSDKKPSRGQITLRTCNVEAAPLPKADSKLIRDTRKRLGAAPAFVIVGQRGPVASDASFRIGIEYHHEPGGLGKGQGAEQHRIDHGKNRQVRAEANGERQKSGSCKCRGLSQ
jgi:hypothetical protein